MKIGIIGTTKLSNKIVRVVDRDVYIIGYHSRGGMDSPILLDSEGFVKIREAYTRLPMRSVQFKDNTYIPEGPIEGLIYIGKDLVGSHIHVGRVHDSVSILKIQNGNNYGSVYWTEDRLPDVEEVNSSDIYYSVNTGDQKVYCERSNYLRVIYPNGTFLEFRNVGPVKENKLVSDWYLEEEVSDKSQNTLLVSLFPLRAVELIKYEGPFGESDESRIVRDIVDYLITYGSNTEFTVNSDRGDQYTVKGGTVGKSNLVHVRTNMWELPYKVLTTDLEVPFLHKMTTAYEGASYSTVDDLERQSLTSNNLLEDNNITDYDIKIYKDNQHVDTLRFVNDLYMFISLNTYKLYT